MMGRCDVCGQNKEVAFCSICKANVCEGCRYKVVDRLIAASKRLAQQKRIGTIR